MQFGNFAILGSRTHVIGAQCTQKRRCSTPCHWMSTSANVWTHTLPAPAPRYYWRFHYILLHWTHRVPTHVKRTRRAEEVGQYTHTHHYAFFAFYSGSSKKHNIIFIHTRLQESKNFRLKNRIGKLRFGESALATGQLQRYRVQSKILRELYIAQWITCACVLTKISVPTFIWRDAAECVAWWPGMCNLAIVRKFVRHLFIFEWNWFHF